jgi:hypothetical protein
VLTVHESDSPFPVTRHYFRIMCNKDILQLFFEDINQCLSPPKISYYYISSVTVSSSNGHQACAGCLLSRHVLLEHLDPWRWDRLVIPRRRTELPLMLRTIPEDRRSQNLFNFSVPFHRENGKWWNLFLNLGFVSPCIIIHSYQPTRCISLSDLLLVI